MLKLNPRKNKHYDDDADEDDERLRPLKIQKLMMTMKLVDDPPPPTIQEESISNRVRVRMRMELEETDDDAPPPPLKKLRKVVMKTEEEETMETRESNRRAWGDLPPEVLELIVKKLKQFDYGSFLGVCKSWEKLKPDVVIQLELGGTVSNIPIRYKRF